MGCESLSVFRRNYCWLWLEVSTNELDQSKHAGVGLMVWEYQWPTAVRFECVLTWG